MARLRSLLALESLRRLEEPALLLLRLGVGGFLVWGVWDNIVSPARMAEFVQFLDRHHFPWPQVMAPVSVYAQLLIGLAFILGLATRWAGLVCAVHFVVAIVMVDRLGGIRASFPAACLVMIGLYLAARGPGRLALDPFMLVSGKRGSLRRRRL